MRDSSFIAPSMSGTCQAFRPKIRPLAPLAMAPRAAAATSSGEAAAPPRVRTGMFPASSIITRSASSSPTNSVLRASAPSSAAIRHI